MRAVAEPARGLFSISTVMPIRNGSRLTAIAITRTVIHIQSDRTDGSNMGVRLPARVARRRHGTYLTESLTRDSQSVILPKYEHSDKGVGRRRCRRSSAASSRTSTQAPPTKERPGANRSRIIWTQSDSAAELETLRSFPSVFLPSAAIPNAGDHVERDHLRGAALRGPRPRRSCAGVPQLVPPPRDGASSRGRAVRTRWCAATTAGPTASTARSRTSRTPRRFPIWTCRRAGWSRSTAVRWTG